MNRLGKTWLLAAAGLTLAVVATPRSVLAQEAGGQAPTDSTAAAPVQTTGVPEYLATHPRVLNLTPKQVDRIGKVRVWLRGQDSTLRAQWKQLTGGRPLRRIPPAERRTLTPQLQPIMQQLRANSAAALDSVDAILTPPQQQKLQANLAEYRGRAQARRGQVGH